MPRNEATEASDAGYASLTAIVLCAAVSVLCAGTLSLAVANNRVEARKLGRVQQEEAINTAVLQFAGDVVASDEPYVLKGDKTIVTSDGHFPVHLTAEAEHAKWPIDKLGEVSETVLGHAIHRDRTALEDTIAAGKPDDCVRSLFSKLGQADPEKDRPMKTGALYLSSSKDGQIWRIRAVSGNRVEERRVRFLGDPNHLFALVSVERMSLGEMPECSDLIGKS